jgi:hypothetical protein
MNSAALRNSRSTQSVFVLEWLTKGDFAMQLRQGILLTVASLMCASAALAQTKNTASTPSAAAATPAKVTAFKDLDKNSDGFLNRTEAASSTGLVAMFPDLDANKDGKLSSQEYAKRAQHP